MRKESSTFWEARDEKEFRETWGFAICGELIFGNHAVNKVGKVGARLGAKKVLVVTDPVIRDAGLLKFVEGPLKEMSISFEVYDQGEPEPSIEKVLECTEFAKKGNYDLIVCLGGGSVIDLGKATAVLMTMGNIPMITSVRERFLAQSKRLWQFPQLQALGRRYHHPLFSPM